MKIKALITVSTIFVVVGAFCIPASAATCASGTALQFSFNVKADNNPPNRDFGTYCSPEEFSTTQVSGGDGFAAGIGIVAGDVGASAGVGGLASNNSSQGSNHQALVSATASTLIDFMLVKVDQSLPDFIFQQISYEVEIITLASSVGVNGGSIATIGGKGTVNIFSIDDLGQMLQTSGVLTAHKNGVNASLAIGDTLRFGSGGVGIEVGRLHRAQFGVNALTQVFALPDLSGGGSASGEFALAISGFLTAPTGYAIQYSGNAPSIGAYPYIGAPLSSIPLPAAFWLFSTALLCVPSIRRRRQIQPRTDSTTEAS